ETELMAEFNSSRNPDTGKRNRKLINRIRDIIQPQLEDLRKKAPEYNFFDQLAIMQRDYKQSIDIEKTSVALFMSIKKLIENERN
ncbi:MAG: hypothetical protein VKN72_11810, partial [Nostocales cyanobacterium 94392]|nr:hypothetical protein [Nostocales cyanobacterium 94392]